MYIYIYHMAQLKYGPVDKMFLSFHKTNTIHCLTQSCCCRHHPSNDNGADHLTLFQEDTACTRLEYCRDLHKLCLHNLCPQRWGPIPFFGRRSLPPGWLFSSQKRGTSSQILARPHTQTNILKSFGFVTSVTNK